MKIGILSDTHNYQDNTRRALETLRARGVTQVIHCGDVTTPAIVYLFSGWNVTFVLGNMDYGELADAVQAIGMPRPRVSAVVEVDGQAIGVTHGADHNLLLGMTMSGKYTYLCHGHTHQRRNEYNSVYGVRLINPGALGGSKPETRSVCVLDAETGAVEFIEFPEMP